MTPSRGTDRAAEERKIRPREDDGDDLGRWLKALFDALSEVSVACLPTLVFALLAAGPATKFVAFATLATFVVGVAAGRQGRLRLGPPWPKLTPLLAVLRLVYYNVVFAVAVGLGLALAPDLGIAVDWASIDVAGAGLVAVFVTGVAVVLFPTAAHAVHLAVTARRAR
jgi:hypothetical protein